MKRDERFAHELSGTLDGIPGYQIRAVASDGSISPALERDEYFPVFYSRENLTSRIYGLDLRDGGTRQLPIDSARDGNLRLRREILSCRPVAVIAWASS